MVIRQNTKDGKIFMVSVGLVIKKGSGHVNFCLLHRVSGLSIQWFNSPLLHQKAYFHHVLTSNITGHLSTVSENV